MAQYDDILARLSPKDRAAIERRIERERAAGERKATRAAHRGFDTGFAAGRAPKPVGAAGRHHGAQYTPKSGRFKGIAFRNRDEYERVAAFGRANVDRSRRMTPEQMGRLTRRAAELGMTAHELWGILFGTP